MNDNNEFKPYKLVIPEDLESLDPLKFERLYDMVEKFHGWSFGQDFKEEMDILENEMSRRKNLKSNKG